MRKGKHYPIVVWTVRTWFEYHKTCIKDDDQDFDILNAGSLPIGIAVGFFAVASFPQELYWLTIIPLAFAHFWMYVYQKGFGDSGLSYYWMESWGGNNYFSIMYFNVGLWVGGALTVIFSLFNP